MADGIELRGLRFDAVHGVLAEERDRPQPFEVDLDIEADLSRAGASDELSDTVDYGAVIDVVAGVMNGPPANLLEHLAERVAAGVLEVTGTRCTSVTATVRKLRPPVAVDLTSAAARVTRSAPRR